MVEQESQGEQNTLIGSSHPPELLYLVEYQVLQGWSRRVGGSYQPFPSPFFLLLQGQRRKEADHHFPSASQERAKRGGDKGEEPLWGRGVVRRRKLQRSLVILYQHDSHETWSLSWMIAGCEQAWMSLWELMKESCLSYSLLKGCLNVYAVINEHQIFIIWISVVSPQFHKTESDSSAPPQATGNFPNYS